MLSADLERIEEQFASVIAEHRKMARAILSEQQVMALGRLETALELHQAAQQAIALNLIAGPTGYVTEPGTRFNEPVAEGVRPGRDPGRWLAERYRPGIAGSRGR